LAYFLELIEKEKLDITEISLSKVTNQYLEKVSSLDPKIYDVTEFMIIAAKLIYLKSKALLPSLETAEEEEELESLKEKLEIYKNIKKRQMNLETF
jgi:segregation and condensation protein A